FNLESELYAFDERMVAIRLSESLSSEQVRTTLEEVESSWQALVGGTGFDYFFVDEAYASSFMAETLLSKIMNIFSSLAILIACLGLLGLTAFTTEQRTKEVGIRKILGANMNNLLVLLSRDLLKWVVLSLLFAIPIAYISIHLWLEDFTYKMDISWFTFIFSIIICLGVAWLTMMYHTLKVANQNPVKALRYE
ncbi:MAG: FtsX-like permease family protein, partial [Bacteroidota bacterium]